MFGRLLLFCSSSTPYPALGKFGWCSVGCILSGIVWYIVFLGFFAPSRRQNLILQLPCIFNITNDSMRYLSNLNIPFSNLWPEAFFNFPPLKTPGTEIKDTLQKFQRCLVHSTRSINVGKTPKALADFSASFPCHIPSFVVNM